MKMLFKLATNDVKARARAAIDTAPLGYIVEIKEAKRNLDQNALLWSLLTEVSEQVNWHGQRLSKEEWKDVFTASLKKQKVVPGLDGGFVVCGSKTSNMTKSEFNELCELILAFASEQDVQITYPESKSFR